MACCGACASGEPKDRSKDAAGNPRAIRIDLDAGSTLGSSASPEAIEVYKGPVYLELWSYDADTVWTIDRARVGREGQRIIAQQRVMSGPVSRRVVEVAAGERATVRAWSRAVAAGDGWNDVTGRYTGTTPAPYIQILTYQDPPIEYGASSAAAFSVASGSAETFAAAHHARYITIYSSSSVGQVEVLDRAGTTIALFPLQVRQVLTASDGWVRFKVTNSGGAAIDVYWIASVSAPGSL